MIGNNFVNIAASALATMIGLRLIGDLGALVATITLTIIVLLFAENYSQNSSYPKTRNLSLHLCSTTKMVDAVINFLLYGSQNVISNSLLALIGVKTSKRGERITPEELRTIVSEAGGLIL